MLRSSSICLSLMYNYLLSDNEYQDESGISVLNKKSQKLRCLSKTFQSHGGILSKISQMLSLDDPTNTVFSDCKPFSKDESIRFLSHQLEKNVEFFQNVHSVDLEVYKSGSVGQVHKAKYKSQDEKDIIIKVQYIGLYEQTQNDLKMLDTLVVYLYNFLDIKNALVDIKAKLNEELDYTKELSNHQLIYNIWKDCDYVKIPEVIVELCTDKILCMEYVEGQSISDFISNSTKEEKNILGEYIFKFTFENVYKHGILYSDIHYGNFLVKEDTTLCVIDFGCLTQIDSELQNNLRQLHISFLNEDKEMFYIIVERMGIINQDTISVESKEYIYKYFRIQYTPLISEDFEFTQEWLDMASNKNIDLMKEWFLPRNMVYFNKIPYGCYNLLTKLQLKCNFLPFFSEILNN